MRKKCCFCLIALSLAHSNSMFGIDADEMLRIRAALTNKASGEYDVLLKKNLNYYQDIKSQLNGTERLLTCSFVESVSVTSTSVIIRTGSPDRVVWWGLEPNAEIILTPDQETRFSREEYAITLSPASLKNKQKGFRVKERIYGPSDGKSIHTAYIALSDTPVEVGEDDVKMVMNDGKWVTAEEARKILGVEEIAGGGVAIMLFQRAEEIKRDPKLMAEVLDHPSLSNIWNILVLKGYIKMHRVEQEDRTAPLSRVKGWFGNREEAASHEGGQDEKQSKSNILWFTVGILLCLVPILYFLWRRLKTGN